MLKKLAYMLVAALLLSWMIGCSSSSVDTSGSTDLSEQFGGYTADDEQVAFGDNALLDDAAAEEDYNDAMAAVPAVDSLIEDPDAGYYHLRIIWGNMLCDSTPVSYITPTDWSGSLTISRGATILRRVIRFEYGQDYIVPRTEPAAIAWVSQTSIHNDGIGVDLYVRTPQAQIDTTYIVDSLLDTTIVVIDTTTPDMEPVTVTFAAGPYTNTFTMDQIAALDTVIAIDANNSVAFCGFRFDHVPCGRGFMAGHWGYDDGGNGIFRGMWLNTVGYTVGYYDGTWAVDTLGVKSFVGKWIHADGSFGGFLRGQWDYHPGYHANQNALRRAGGWYWGEIYDANGDPIGLMKGNYRSHPQFRNGSMNGRWKLRCVGGAEGSIWDSQHDGF